MDLAQEIESFVRHDLAMNQNLGGLSRSDNLLELGVVDSLGILKLSAFLEEAFGIRVADDDLLPEYFESLDAITKYASSKL